MAGTFTTSSTDTSVTITVTGFTVSLDANYNKIEYSVSGNVTSTDNFVAADLPITTTITGLSPSTAYSISWSLLEESGYTLDVDGGTISVTTKNSGFDEPKTATQEQWEDLATRIKAKANTSDVPTITMTTTDPGEGSALAENHYVAVYGGDPIILDYSTSETNTGTYWIDGSAIYKKTINTGTLPNATTKSVAYNISGLSRVIAANGYAYRTSDGGSFPLPFVSTTSANSIAFSINTTTGTIEIVTGIDRSNITESYITFYYTKSS